MNPLFIELPLILLLLFFSAFFSGSETAFFSLSNLQLEKLVQKSPKKGDKIRNILKQPRQLIITIILGNEFVNIAISSISAGIIINIFGQETPWINIALVLPVLLLFGEITPKTFAIYNNEKFSSFAVTPLTFFEKWIAPLIWLIRKISDKIANIFVKESSRKGSILTEDVVKTIIEEGEKEGVLDTQEKERIYKIFDFGDTKVNEVMTLRSNLFYLPVEMPLTEMIQKIKQKHFSKVPIYKKNHDNIIGVLFATDLIGLPQEKLENSKSTLKMLLRKPYFTPDTKRVDELFRTFQRKKISLSVVLDEYGGVQGLVTMEDLLEEIFGEIADEYEKEQKHHEKLADRIFKVKANMPLPDFNILVGSKFTSDEVETIGGLVFSLFGELPQEKMSIKYHNLDFVVEKISGNRIDSLIVKKK